MKNSYELFWGAVVTLLPIFYRREWGSRLSMQVGLVACICVSILLFGGGISKYIPKKSFVLICILGLFNRGNIASFTFFIQWVSVCSGLLLVSQMSEKIKNINCVYTMLAIACIFHSLWVVIEWVGFSPYHWFFMKLEGTKVLTNHGYGYTSGVYTKPLTVGAFSHYNLTGAYIAMCLPVFFRRAFLPYIFLPIGAILLLGSALPMLTAAVGATIYIGCKLRVNLQKCIASIISAICSLTILCHIPATHKYFSWFKNNGRFPVWEDTITWLTGLDVLIGRGLGYFYDEFPRTFTRHGQVFQQAHNEYLEIYIAFGAIGVILFLWSLRPVFKAKDPVLIAGILASLINMVGHFTLHIAGTALVAIIYYSQLFKEKEHGNIRI